MCHWESNETHKDKGTTAAGHARLEGLCPPPVSAACACACACAWTRTRTRTRTQTRTRRRRRRRRRRRQVPQTAVRRNPYTCRKESKHRVSDQGLRTSTGSAGRRKRTSRQHRSRHAKADHNVLDRVKLPFPARVSFGRKLDAHRLDVNEALVHGSGGVPYKKCWNPFRHQASAWWAQNM